MVSKNHKIFKDPLTGKQFQAIRVNNHDGLGWLVPLWVKSKPEEWIEVKENLKEL